MSQSVEVVEYSYIYGLIDPRTDELRYIGKARNPEKRYKQHCRLSECTKNTPNHKWLLSLLSNNLLPRLCIFERALDWEVAERKWIALYRTEGARLTNVADGGCEMSSAHRKPKHPRYQGTQTPLQALKIRIAKSPSRKWLYERIAVYLKWFKKEFGEDGQDMFNLFLELNNLDPLAKYRSVPIYDYVGVDKETGNLLPSLC